MGELTQVEINLPGNRWTLSRSKKNLARGWVKAWFKDSKGVANIYFVEGLRQYQHRYDTIDEWFEKDVGLNILEKYGKGNYDVLSEARSEATLGSGQRVKTVSYFLLIRDKSRRNVRFAYFPNQDETRWSIIFVCNSGVDQNQDDAFQNQDDAFQKIMNGISLRSVPMSRVQK